MAENTPATRVPLTRSRLAALKALTQAVSEAVLEADLDRAAALLEQRQAALQHLDWNTAANEQLQQEIHALWAMEAKLLDFCRTWRNILQGRLKQLHTNLHLTRRYCPASSESCYVDLHK